MRKETMVRGIYEERRPWEPMVLTDIGRLGDIMQGGTGSRGDGGGTMKA
jgi:hypothetical protein